MKKILLALPLALLFPIAAQAAWYNPLTWFTPDSNPIEQSINVSTSTNATTSKPEIKVVEIASPAKVVEKVVTQTIENPTTLGIVAKLTQDNQDLKGQIASLTSTITSQNDTIKAYLTAISQLKAQMPAGTTNTSNNGNTTSQTPSTPYREVVYPVEPINASPVIVTTDTLPKYYVENLNKVPVLAFNLSNLAERTSDSWPKATDIKSIKVNITGPATNAYIYLNSTLLDSEYITDGQVTFNNIILTLGGENFTLVVRADFSASSTISASLNGSDIEGTYQNTGDSTVRTTPFIGSASNTITLSN